MLGYKRLGSSDFSLMLNWLAKPHVKKWWDDGDDTLEKIRRHYGQSDGTARFILSYDQVPIGYFQYYLVDSSTVGIDQFIGEENYLGRGIGTEAVKSFVDLIINKLDITGIILDPSPQNSAAIRCYEKAGFKHYETVEAGNCPPAYMMRLEIQRKVDQW